MTKLALIPLLVPGAFACDLCAVYSSSAARGESTAGFHLTIAEQFTHSGTLQEEGSEIHDPADQYRDSSITTAIVGYNFNPRLGLGLNVPYIYRSFRRAEGGEIENGTESGLGDISLIGRLFALTRAETDYSFSLSFLGGVEFPTGDSDRLREEVEEEEQAGPIPSGVHGNDLALGSGSFDGIVGAAAHFRWKRFLASVEGQYFLRTEGDFDYQFGNELSIFGGPGAYILFSPQTTLAVQAGFSYESKAHDQVSGQKRDDGIVTSWYASPGLAFTYGEHFSTTLNVDIPIDIFNRAFQVVPDYRIRGGATWSF